MASQKLPRSYAGCLSGTCKKKALSLPGVPGAAGAPVTGGPVVGPGRVVTA